MRELFHVPDNYFLSHSVGCLPKQTPPIITNSFIQPWQKKGGHAWEDWMGIIEQFRSNIGWLLNTTAQNICPQTNISSGLTKIIYSLPDLGHRNTILCSEEDFPTIGFVLKQAERMGFQIRFVKGDVSKASTWTEAMDESVGIVHITHAFSNSSQFSPIRVICETARQKHIVSIVDIAQSVGAVSIDLSKVQPDFALGTSVKFLCGGPGACFLYASNEMLSKADPIDVGWFSHENPFEMDIHNFKYADSAMRFFGGTPSPLPFATANSALELWKHIEPPQAHKHIQACLNYLTDQTSAQIQVSPAESYVRGATHVLAPTNRDKTKTLFSEHNFQFDERNEGFRFSVHGYTGQNEIEKLGQVLALLD